MFSRSDPPSPPSKMTQDEEERVFSQQIQEAECNAVTRLAADDHSSKIVFRIINNAQGFAETAYEMNRSPGPSRVVCKEGCNWCCYQSVHVSAPEAFRIAGFLMALQETARTEAVDRLRELDRRTRGLTPAERAALKPPCPFLSDGRCMIYPVRPLNCAGFTSFNVEDCKASYHEGFLHARVIGERARTLVYRAVRSGLAKGLREALPESDTAPLELTAAVVNALSSPEALREWLAGRPVFEGAHFVEEEE
ncbi:MAG: YkgJ family cysteine cluster protein [Silvibacterium sp.]